MEFFSQKLWENNIYLLQNTAFFVLATWPQQCKKKKILPQILLRTVYHYLGKVSRLTGWTLWCWLASLSSSGFGWRQGTWQRCWFILCSPCQSLCVWGQSDVGFFKLSKLGKLETTPCCFLYLSSIYPGHVHSRWYPTYIIVTNVPVRKHVMGLRIEPWFGEW